MSTRLEMVGTPHHDMEIKQLVVKSNHVLLAQSDVKYRGRPMANKPVFVTGRVSVTYKSNAYHELAMGIGVVVLSKTLVVPSCNGFAVEDAIQHEIVGVFANDPLPEGPVTVATELATVSLPYFTRKAFRADPILEGYLVYAGLPEVVPPKDPSGALISELDPAVSASLSPAMYLQNGDDEQSALKLVPSLKVVPQNFYSSVERQMLEAKDNNEILRIAKTNSIHPPIYANFDPLVKFIQSHMTKPTAEMKLLLLGGFLLLGAHLQKRLVGSVRSVVNNGETLRVYVDKHLNVTL